MKYSQKIVAGHKIAICHYKKTIQSLRKKKMNVMVSLGQWLYFLRPLPVQLAIVNSSSSVTSTTSTTSTTTPQPLLPPPTPPLLSLLPQPQTPFTTKSCSLRLSEDPHYVTTMREASYEAYVDPYRGMMLSDFLQSSVAVGPSASAAVAAAAAAAASVANITDADAAKDINQGSRNHQNVQEENLEKEEGSDKQASKDNNLRAAKGGVLREEEETPLGETNNSIENYCENATGEGVAIVNNHWTQLLEDPNYVTAMKEASYEAYVDPYRGMMLTDDFQSSVGVRPSASAAATAAVADTTHADAHAAKDINR